MTSTVSIEYTDTFRKQLYNRFQYLARQLGEKAAHELLTGFLDSFENRIANHPKSSPLCLEATDIGLESYHDFIDSKRQLRAVYRIAEADKKVYGLLFLSTRQSIREALIQYCLQ